MMDKLSEARMKLASLKTLRRQAHDMLEFCELRPETVLDVDMWFDVCESRLKSFIEDKMPQIDWDEEGKKQVEMIRNELMDYLCDSRYDPDCHMKEGMKCVGLASPDCPRKVTILDNNPLSIASYLEDHPDIAKKLEEEE